MGAVDRRKVQCALRIGIDLASSIFIQTHAIAASRVHDVLDLQALFLHECDDLLHVIIPAVRKRTQNKGNQEAPMECMPH